LTKKKTVIMNEGLWNSTSKRLLVNFSIPLVTGGVFVLLGLGEMPYHFVFSSLLLFYGLALVNGSKYTLTDLRSLGVLEILLGLINIVLVNYSFVFLILGFGVLNIVYGIVLHYKYDRD